MGQRGFPPVPTAVLERRGSWRAKARKKRGEPQPEPGSPSMPSHLTGMARICWTWTTKQLAAMGVLSQADRQTLERYCMLYARWREVETFLKKEGHTYAKTDKAGLVTGFGMHPEVRIAHALVDQLLRLEAQFGLTPSSRTRLVASREPTPAAPQGKQRFFRKGLEVVK